MPEILAYGFWMRKEGYSETTIERYVRLLKELGKHGDLRDPETVKVSLTRTSWADGTKEMARGAYAIYAKQHGFAFVNVNYFERAVFVELVLKTREESTSAMGPQQTKFSFS